MIQTGRQYKYFKFNEYLPFAMAVDRIYGLLSHNYWHTKHIDSKYYLMIDTSCLDFFKIPDNWLINEVK